jgi:hypothetical protein
VVPKPLRGRPPTGRPIGGPHVIPRGVAGPPLPAIGLATSLAAIEYKLGGRDALVAALSHAPYSQTLSLLLGLVGDPIRSSTPLATLCAMAGVTAGELLEAYKAGELNRSQALAIHEVGDKLADVAKVTMTAALQTGGDVDEQRLALDHRKLAFDLGKMLPKSAGVSIAVQQNNSTHMGVAGGSLEKLQEATDKLLFGSDLAYGALDAEVVSVEDQDSESPLAATGESIDADTPVIEADWRGDVP